MRKTILIIAAVFLTVGVAGVGHAGQYAFDASLPGFFIMDHLNYYTWGICWDDQPEGEVVGSAQLIISGLYNDQIGEENYLYIHLLDANGSFLMGSSDGMLDTTVGDEFSGKGVLLITYSDTIGGWEGRQDLVYSFTQDQIDVLSDYASDGYFAFGIDSDCVYIDNGVSFEIKTHPVPEPLTLSLLASGFVGLGGMHRVGVRLRKSKK